jgi:hypothetical protein
VEEKSQKEDINLNKNAGDGEKIILGVKLNNPYTNLYVGIYYNAPVNLKRDPEHNRPFDEEYFRPNDPDQDDSWIPYGYFYDLTDARNNLEPEDCVEGHTISQIYNTFSPTVDSPIQFHRAFSARYGTSACKNDLLNWYGF